MDRRRLVDQRAEAFSEFARHLIDYRRAELHRWHEVDDARQAGQTLDSDDAPSAPEARSSRSAAWGNYYRMRLLWDDQNVMTRAMGLLHDASGLEHASDADQVKNAADRLRRISVT